jgi:uncharacterized protein YndB with AHSA1/START domain
MSKIVKQLKLGLPPETAFKKFVNELNEWWPKEYTWSQDKLQEIRIDAQQDGLCTEIGPYRFRCDWGRITALIENQKIALKWQIGPKREPIPDPDKASDLSVRFVQDGDSTSVILEHANFENHGPGSGDYRKMMDSEQGWEHLLNKFKAYCEK